MKTGVSFKMEIQLGGLFIAAAIIATAISVATFRRPPKPKPPRRPPVQPQPSDHPPAGEAVETPAAETETPLVERDQRFKPKSADYHARRDAALAEFKRVRLPEIQAELRESIRARLEQPFFDMTNALAAMSVALPQPSQPKPEQSPRRPIFSTPAAGQGAADV